MIHRGVIDGLCVVGPYRVRPPGTDYDLDSLLSEHRRFGIGARLSLHAESRDGVPAEGNAEMSRLAKAAPGTATIWTALPPRRFDGESAERLLEDAQAAGVAMLAMFPVTNGHHLAPWANGDLYATMAEARLPLVLDAGQADYTAIQAIATAYPRLPIVVWNANYMDERLHVPLLDTCPNVHIGLATIFIPTGGIERYTARYGPGRLVFGSNWPAQSPGPLLTYVLYAEVDQDAKAAILGGTISRLAADVAWPVAGLPEALP